MTRLTTRLRWAVARYPRQVDALVVGLLTLGTLVEALLSVQREGPPLVDAAFVIAMAVPLLCLRSHPLAAVVGWAVLATLMSVAATDYQAVNFSFATLVYVIFVVAVETRDRHWVVPFLVLWLAGSALAIADVPDVPNDLAGNLTVSAAFAGALLVGGRALANGRLLTRELADRAREIERSREAHALLAVSEERARIAEELQAIVSTEVRVMAADAEAVRALCRTDPAAAAERFEGIETTGREALTEMRRLLGVLRASADAEGAR